MAPGRRPKSTCRAQKATGRDAEASRPGCCVGIRSALPGREAGLVAVPAEVAQQDAEVSRVGPAVHVQIAVIQSVLHEDRVTAGASAPEELVQQVITTLKSLGGSDAEEIPGREENIRFSMPKALRS